MSRRLILTLYIIIGYCGILAAQDTDRQRAVYDRAAEAYAIGRIEQAKQLLTENINTFHTGLKESGYRLLALCCLSLDETEAAERYVQLLLDENRYYSPSVGDPQRFIDMVMQINGLNASTITTASNQAENLNEVPVPTTLITEEMIRNCGARNLREVLAAYVPGMTIVDCNDDINIAMRGIYSNGQEKILIMLNGHRLNSYCTNTAPPDFSMGLDKLKQIEVLRGPASSLYGGVALTAVVNLITKNGADIDGLKAKGGIGSYGQLRGNLMFGKRYFDLDLLIWGNIYKADGQKFYVPPYASVDSLLVKKGGNVSVGNVGSKPSYDVGVSMRYRGLQFLYNTRFSQVVSPFTMSYLYAPYDHNLYMTHNGIGPSFTTNTHHAELNYGYQLGKLFLKGTATFDNSELTHYQVISDTPQPFLGYILGLPDAYSQLLYDKDGLSRYINGQEQTWGLTIKGDYNYINNRIHKGSLSFGVEYSNFELEDARYLLGYNFTNRIPETNTISEQGKGHEHTSNAFIQLKHQWQNLILNVGLRFDYKKNYNSSHIDEKSPRLALIYLKPHWNMKLSYSKAFIDAPYLYRKTNDYLSYLTQKPRATLTPESFHSYQLTFAGTQWLPGLDVELNGFFNQARDLIYMQIIDHKNTGLIDTYGLEAVAKYNSKKLFANLSLTWQKLHKGEIFNYDVDKQFNIPSFSSNLVLAWKPIRQLNLHTHLTYYSSQKAYSIDLVNTMAQTLMASMSDGSNYDLLKMLLGNYLKEESRNSIEISEISPRLLVNVGADYTLGRFELGLNVHNLLNKSYHQSGMSTGLIPQQGRWLMFEVGYKF